MAPPEPDPAAADAVPEPAVEADVDGTAEVDEGAVEEEAEPEVDPGEARRTRTGLMWTCAGLTAVVGIFELARVVMNAKQYDVLAWLGAIVAFVALVALIAGYVLCALGRTTLQAKLIGRFDFFQVSTVVVLLAIVAGVLVVAGSTTALALLLPWGLTYWLHNLNPAPAI
jgi:hypothetical protein